MRLSDDPAVHRLARDLRLPRRGDPLLHIREHALDQVRRALAAFPEHVADLDTLRRVLANSFRLRVEFINDDELIEVTPDAIRLRKRSLDPIERKKAMRRAAAEAREA